MKDDQKTQATIRYQVTILNTGNLSNLKGNIWKTSHFNNKKMYIKSLKKTKRMYVGINKFLFCTIKLVPY